MTRLQRVFVRNLRNERKRAGLTQEKAAEKIGITASYYSALEGSSNKFPSVQKIQDIAAAFGISPYRLFLDTQDVALMPSSELLDKFIDFLSRQYRKELLTAKSKFLKGLETQRETGKNPFEGEEMSKE